MSNIVCIKHKDFKGLSAPDLSCTTCCSIYIEQLKVQREKKAKTNDFEAKNWGETKPRDVVANAIKKGSANIFKKFEITK